MVNELNWRLKDLDMIINTKVVKVDTEETSINPFSEFTRERNYGVLLSQSDQKSHSELGSTDVLRFSIVKNGSLVPFYQPLSKTRNSLLHID